MHTRSCPVYGNYQPPYEECDCGDEGETTMAVVLEPILAQAFREVEVELRSAMKENIPMHSLHEGLAVIEEEVHELRLEVYKNPRKHPDRRALARHEAVQVAAMALRLLHDVL